MFIYKALVESVTCGLTEIETQNLRIQINRLSTNEKGNRTGFDEQFQVALTFIALLLFLFFVFRELKREEEAVAFCSGLFFDPVV